MELEQYRNAVRIIEINNLKEKEKLGNAKKKLTIAKILKKFRNHSGNKKYFSTVQVISDSNLSEQDFEKLLCADSFGKKIAVYTCIMGGYDNLLDPYFKHSEVDFYYFSDQDYKVLDWNRRTVPANIMELGDNVLINRYLKLHPYELFPDYDYVIYIDGNIQVTSDLFGLTAALNDEIGIAMHKHYQRKDVYLEGEALQHVKRGNLEKVKYQMDKYRKEGFPQNFGLAEATIILSDPNNSYTRKIFDEWWKEFIATQSMRDQLSFPYIIWKLGISMDSVTTLGNDLRKSSKFRKIDHHSN